MTRIPKLNRDRCGAWSMQITRIPGPSPAEIGNGLAGSALKDGSIRKAVKERRNRFCPVRQDAARTRMHILSNFGMGV